MVGPNITLRRPDETELEQIRNVLMSYTGNLSTGYHYEYNYHNVDESKTEFVEIVDPDQWHYYVLSDDSGGSFVYELMPMLSLIEPSLDLSVRVSRQINRDTGEEQVAGYSPPAPHVIDRHYHFLTKPTREVVHTANFDEAYTLQQTLEGLDSHFNFIRNAVNLLSDARLVSPRSSYFLLGLFASIESLIIHKPRHPESVDSVWSSPASVVSQRFLMNGCNDPRTLTG